MRWFTYLLLAIFLNPISASAYQPWENSFQSSFFRVVDESSNPIKDAEVMLGSAPGNPFPGNVLMTDQHGRIQTPLQWKSRLPITISAHDFVTTTYVESSPAAFTDFVLKQSDGQLKLSIDGKTTDFGRLRRDGMVDFALVIKALKKEDLLHFDMSNVLSSEVDIIRVAGQRFEVPSNLTLPKQRETYVIPISFNKPDYRMRIRNVGDHRFIATHGRFPIKDVVKDLRNGNSVFDILNYFEFIGGGLKDVRVQRSVSNQNIAVNEFQFDQKVVVQAPAIPNNSVMISLALSEKDNFLFPTDVKRLTSGESRNLTTSGNGMDKYILSVLVPMKSPDQDNSPATGIKLDQISLVFESAGSTKPEFLSLVPPPQINGQNIQVTPPVPLNNVQPAGTIFILSEIESIKVGKLKSERRTRVWELFGHGWIDHVQLPKIALQLDPGKKYRWEVIFLGESTRNNGGKNGSGILENVTHIARSALDI